MSSRLLVERALALVPEGEDFLPLMDAVIGASFADVDKRWARSSAYATVGKRLVDPARIEEMIPSIVQKAQERLEALFTLVVQALREQQAGNLAGAAELLVRAGELEEADRRLEKAAKVYTLALEVADDLREKGPQILALRRLGRVARAAGRLQEGWTRYEQSYQLSRDEMHVPGQAIACQGLGNVCSDRGEREEARAWYERGLELARGLDDPELSWPFYLNLSNLAILRGELSEAEALLAEARLHIDRAGNGSAVPFWHNSQGVMLVEHGAPEEAERIYREGMERTDAPFWKMTLRINLGHALARQDRLFEAEEEARRAEELAVVHRFVPDLVDVYDLLGAIARARCDEEGFVFYEQALEVCRERELPQVKVAGIYHGYGRLYRACGRPAEARAYLEQARDVYRRLGLTPELRRVEEEMEASAAPA